MPTPVISVGAALDFAQRRLGGPLSTKETNPTATTTVAQLLENNADRMVAIIFNLGANDVYIAFNSAVSSTNGIKLVASGGFIIIQAEDDFTIQSFPIFAIANGGNSAMYVFELIRIVQTVTPVGT